MKGNWWLSVTPERVAAFRQRIIEEGRDFCHELFMYEEVHLMAAKYAYYILDNPYMDDNAYDIGEKSWATMGIALGEIDETVSSPCVDFDENHRSAEAGKQLAFRLVRRR